MDKDDFMILRHVEWRKAKGHLEALLEFWMSTRDGKNEEESFLKMNEKTEEFINWVENESPIL